MAVKKSKNSEPGTTSAALGESGAPINPATTVVTKTKEPTKMANQNQNSILELAVNLEDFEDFEILPDGNYEAECVLAEVRTSDKGNNYYYTNWKIEPSNYPMDYDVANAPDGMTLNYSRIQVPTAEDRRSITNVKKLMSSLGISLKTSVIDPSLWVGKKASINVGHEEYNGENRNRIVGIESTDA